MLKSWTCKAAPAGRGVGGVRRGQRGAESQAEADERGAAFYGATFLGTRGPFRLWRPRPGVARPPGSLTASPTSRSPGGSHPGGRRRVCNQKAGLHLLASSSHGEPDPQMSPPGPAQREGREKTAPARPRQPVGPGSLSPPSCSASPHMRPAHLLLPAEPCGFWPPSDLAPTRGSGFTPSALRLRLSTWPGHWPLGGCPAVRALACPLSKQGGCFTNLTVFTFFNLCDTKKKKYRKLAAASYVLRTMIVLLFTAMRLYSSVTCRLALAIYLYED